MFPNWAVVWISFSLGFSLRGTHLVPSNWHMECFTYGPATVTHVAVDDYLSHRCFSLYFLARQPGVPGGSATDVSYVRISCPFCL